jgi:hypothetical protein
VRKFLLSTAIEHKSKTIHAEDVDLLPVSRSKEIPPVSSVCLLDTHMMIPLSNLRWTIRWYILIVSLIVMPLSWNNILSCNVILVQRAGESSDLKQGFGFFSTATYDIDNGDFLGCVDFSNYWQAETNDTGFTSSRAFAGLLGAFITLATFICILVQCFNRHGKSCLWSVMKWSYMAAFLCQGACFLLWRSDLCSEFEDQVSQCSFGSDGIASIFNCALLFGMVIATFNSSPPRNPVFRCWHATESDFETDSECSKEEVIADDKETEIDVESQNPNSAAQASRRSSSRSIRTMKSSRSGAQSVKSHRSATQSTRDDGSVSLFSSKSWLSNPQKLTVKQHARRLEKKGNLWPMNQLNPQWPTRDYQGAPKKFVPIPENTNVGPFRAANISALKLSGKGSEDPAIDAKSGLPKTGLVPASVADMYLKQLRARQLANGITENIVPGKKKATKQPEEVTKASSKASTQKGEISPAASFLEAQLGKSIESLAKGVILEKGGFRKEETLVGSTLKIVDEYPRDTGSSKSDENDATKMITGSGVITVRIENVAGGRKTVMEETRPDGSRVVTTLIDPLPLEQELSGV